jgi:hypothetical protein
VAASTWLSRTRICRSRNTGSWSPTKGRRDAACRRSRLPGSRACLAYSTRPLRCAPQTSSTRSRRWRRWMTTLGSTRNLPLHDGVSGRREGAVKPRAINARVRFAARFTCVRSWLRTGCRVPVSGTFFGHASNECRLGHLSIGLTEPGFQEETDPGAVLRRRTCAPATAVRAARHRLRVHRSLQQL